MNNVAHTIEDPRLGIGPKGEIAHVDLLEHSKKFAPTLHKITDGVYHLIGVRSVANCTLIEGQTGIILVDSGSSIDDAEAFLVEFRKVTDKPIVAVLYTHSHYCRGASAFIPEENPESVQVWGHEQVHQNYLYGRPEIFPTYTRKIATQMGNLCPKEGPDAAPNAGLGGEYIVSTGRYGYVKPTHTVNETTDIEIDGVNIRLIPSISDTDDCLNIWLPEQKVMIENIFWRVLPNFGAIRGEFYRKPMLWAQSVDDIRALEPEHILGCHGIPYSGKDVIDQLLLEYRDAIQYLYDQAIRGINQGKDADALVETIDLPASLQQSEGLQQHYGEFQFGLRGVYNGMMGWFGTDTAQLKPVPKRVEAERIVNGFGGSAKVEAEAIKYLEEQDFAWSAQLSSYLLRLEPENADYRQLKASALRSMGRLSRSSITRNYYLTQARELEGKVDSFSIPYRSVGKVRSAEPQTYLDALRYELDPQKAEGFAGQVVVSFSDASECFALTIRNSVLLVEENDNVACADRLELDMDTWAELIGGELSLKQAIGSGAAKVTGNEQAVLDFFAKFDHPNLA